MDYLSLCPPSVADLIRTSNLESPDGGMLFSQIASRSALECQVAAVGAIADRLTPYSDPQALDDFFGAVATYARFLPPEDIAAVRDAYLRVPYQPALALNYFGGLMATGIDIRGRLKNRVPEDWSFTQPRRDAATWHYHLYLASLGDARALQALADKIAATTNGNDATNLLQSLSELKADGVEAILQSYADDPRTADGTEGPGLPISENIKLFMMMRATP